MRTMLFLVLSAGLTLAGPALAKGLDELSQSNPEDAPAPAGGATEGGAAQANVPAMTQSATSKGLADKLSLTTSFGWVSASKSKGDWHGSGMSDLAVGYKLAEINAQMNIAGTYRYAPVAVSGVEDDRSYRGVWETHLFGARMNYVMSPTMTVVGTGEVGYTQVHLKPTDGEQQVTKHEASGGQIALGGGADFQLFEKGMTVGPKLVLGFGSFTTIQVAGSFGFLF